MASKKTLNRDPNDLLPLARTSLAAYAALVFPGYKLFKHHSLLVDRLEAVADGKITRLMVSMPPRMGKSLTCSELLPPWFLGRNPSKSVICASYSQEFVEGFGRKVRNFVADSRTSAVFPELKLSDDSTSMKRFDTTAGGSYYAVGRGGSATGRGGDLIICDDPLKDADESRSEIVRKQLHEWFSSVLYTRKQPNTAIIIISTRWHFDDLTGWLLKEHPEERWNVLNLAAIADTDEGWRKEGEPLWPERFPLEEMEQTKRMLGMYAWSALYQQRPVPEEGAIFKTEWWKRWSELPKLTRVIVSADTAFQTGKSSDYSVFTAWGEAQTGFYLLDLWRGRVEFPQLKRELITFAARWKASKILVENAASGQSLFQELKQGTKLPVFPIKVDKDKVSRAHAASPLVEAGRVFIPGRAPWLPEFFDEMATFPAGAHDDIVDSVTQGLNYMRGSNMTYGLWGAMKILQSGSSEQLDAALGRTPAPVVAPIAPTCSECGSDFIQKLQRGLRCGQCGHQWGAPAEPIPANQRMPFVQNAWRM